jgi:hypothetical protein
MHDSQRYRSNASECLLASYEATQPCYGRLNVSMAALWLALAGQDQAIDDLLASWGVAEPIETDGLVRLPRRSARTINTNLLERRSPVYVDNVISQN